MINVFAKCFVIKHIIAFSDKLVKAASPQDNCDNNQYYQGHIDYIPIPFTFINDPSQKLPASSK